MKLSVKALTLVLAAVLVVAFSSDVMAQRGRGGSGLGFGPGGGVPGSVECINSSAGSCPYYGKVTGYGRGYGFKADTVCSQKATGSYRGFQGRGYGRGNAWR